MLASCQILHVTLLTTHIYLRMYDRGEKLGVETPSGFGAPDSFVRISRESIPWEPLTELLNPSLERKRVVDFHRQHPHQSQ